VRVQARIVRQLADAAGIHSLSSAATQAGAGIKAIARLGKGDGPTLDQNKRRAQGIGDGSSAHMTTPPVVAGDPAASSHTM
jgi:hypothetical protein